MATAAERRARGQQGPQALEQLHGAEVVDRHQQRRGPVGHARDTGAGHEALQGSPAAVGDLGDGRGPTLRGAEVGVDLGALQVDPDHRVSVSTQSRRRGGPDAGAGTGDGDGAHGDQPRSAMASTRRSVLAWPS